MALPSFARVWLLAALALLAIRAQAAEIVMKNGLVYQGVTIVHRDADSVEIVLQYGRATLPLVQVASIDGVPLWPTPTPATPPPSAAPSPPPPALGPSPAATLVPANAPPPSAAQPSPTADSRRPHPVATAPPWPDPDHRPNFEILLLVLAAISVVWVASAALVQRDLYDRRANPAFWGSLPILLPFLGYLLYRGVRQVAEMHEKRLARRSVNEVVADREKDKTVKTRHRQGFEFLDEDRKAVLVKDGSEASGIENAQDVLEEALLSRASDVHIEPSSDLYRVRLRIDGFMHERMSFPAGEGLRMVSALKTLAQIDVAERRKAQDGRFGVKTNGRDVDFRVATSSSVFGEKMVIRILDHKTGLLGLSELGMSERMMAEFVAAIRSRSGMILATGPTGSGKTSTLYAALSQVDVTKFNVVTIEDPVEYELRGATQMPVNVKAGVTYESGLRSILRQDPDVILVGEMRDLEAAQIALRAALTGHLVFSSLHTRDAIGTLVRLEEMGIERHLLASALFVLVAQRLVRVLCPACRQPYPSKADELLEIGIELPEGHTIFRAVGCKECLGSGYLGRTGLFEMLVFDEPLRAGVLSGSAGEAAFTELARAKGYRGYREDGAEKVLLGITSVDEILQAT